ncbi:MAG TPA: triose-phosphate isomerase [Thermohalobaculum sp.]|nr:triose-phosphate isomerase [Thermohalobaculum sp.]
MTRRKIAAGNWKMHGLAADLAELEALIGATKGTAAEVILCPPATLLARFAERARGSHVSIGGQDCHPEPGGAHTGDIAAGMLADAGAACVIVGHSERRADHNEPDALVRAKAEAAWRAGLVAIVCVGETETERDAGRARDVVARQLEASVPHLAEARNTVIAYEPVWAIGTGRTPTPDDIAAMHGFIRAELKLRFGPPMAEAVRILYGGSVKPANAGEIFAVTDVDGGLVGGASLKAVDFVPIVAAAG